MGRKEKEILETARFCLAGLDVLRKGLDILLLCRWLRCVSLSEKCGE